MERHFPQGASLLREAAEEVLASMDFPPEPWRGIPSTNLLERLNRELARRCDGVGIFPNVAKVCACWAPCWRSSRTRGGCSGAPSVRHPWQGSRGVMHQGVTR